MVSPNQIPVHSASVVTRKTGEEYVLVPVTGNIADMDSIYTLNSTGAFIWEQIDGKNSLEEIIAKLTEEYETDPETAGKDVLAFIEIMVGIGMVEMKETL
ncbi:MAG: PqqD family protein [Bacteroidales bacterium]|nr:PqqD family protein [Bacteroidales bacterium]